MGKEKQITKNIIDIYLSMNKYCRMDLADVGKSGWTLDVVREAKLNNRNVLITESKRIDKEKSWKYIKDRLPVENDHIYGSSFFYNFREWIPDDIPRILERSVKYLTAPGYTIIDVISEEVENDKKIGFLLDDKTEIVEIGLTYEEVALKLFLRSWEQINNFLRPGLADLIDVVDVNDAYMGEPTIEVSTFFKYKDLKSFSRYINFSLDHEEHNDYKSFRWTQERDRYLGTIELMEGEFHVVFKGYSKSREDSGDDKGDS